MIFGQLGNDTLIGDGALEDAAVGAARHPSVDDPLGPLTVSPAVERSSDGDDYIEGGGGADVIFGGLGQDDLIGGSSSLFSLTSAELRPDGDDLIFGGSGQRIAINIATGDFLDPRSTDADVIIGDNGNIVRLLSGGALAHFDYNPTLIMRAVTLLDGAGNDEIHGESGEDAIYGGEGQDRLFGDAENDDVIGGGGNDWISGGTGDDGLLGDDGRIRTTGSLGTIIKVAVVSLPDAGGDDVIFGGLGNDVIDGGAGDDALSGAEASLLGYAADRNDGNLSAIVRSDFTRPYNPGGLLHYSFHSAGDTQMYFALLDEAHRYERVLVGGLPFMLTNDPLSGPVVSEFASSDGNDRIEGGAGNDWIVGGTGNDYLSGGVGDDLINADDDVNTDGGLNRVDDPDPSYADVLIGGGGRDVFITNNAGDRINGANTQDSTRPGFQAGAPREVQGPTGTVVSPNQPVAVLGTSLNPRLDRPATPLNAAAQKAKAKKAKAKAKKKTLTAKQRKAAAKKKAAAKRRAAAKKKAAAKKRAAAKKKASTGRTRG